MPVTNRTHIAIGLALVAAALLTAACGSGRRPAAVRIEPVQPARAETAPQAGAKAPPPGTKEQPSRPTVFLDPGHGGRDLGWGSASALGGGSLEKDLNLDMAKRTAAYLERDGFRVVLSRTTDTDVNEPERDVNGDGVLDVVDELQARADLANASGAAVLLSLHFNGLPGTALGGASTWYNAKREFSDKNRRLATLVQQAQLKALADLGYPPRDWGALPDDTFKTPRQSKVDDGYEHITLIGPPGPHRTRPSRMPGAIAEPLFLTNPKEAELAKDPQVRDALARAYAQAIRAFLQEERPAGRSSLPPGDDAPGPARLVDRGRTSEKVVALTFDAGAGLGYTQAMLDTLARKDVKATFGLTGAWCEAYPELARRITAEGHAVINHGYSHASWTGRTPKARPLTAEQRRDDLQRAEEALERATGASGRPFFRSPYGDQDAGVQQNLGELGYRYNVLWTFDSRAWKGARVDEIVRRGVRAAVPGAIYVLHLAELQDALALAPLIDRIAAAGYGFVTVPRLLAGE